MTLIDSVYATVSVSKIMLPPMFLGFLIANFVRRSSYFDCLNAPTARLNSVSRLPSECSAALTLFLVNNWTALAVLSELLSKRSIKGRDVTATILVGYLPKGLNSILFFSIPVAFSVLGPSTGCLYVLLDFSAYLMVAAVGMIAGRSFLTSRETESLRDDHLLVEGLVERIKLSFKESIYSSIKIFKTLIPAIFLIQLAIDYLMASPITYKYGFVLESLGLSASSMIVLFASIASQNAALAASGTLLSNHSITERSCLLLLFMAKFIHMGIGSMRIGLPANVAYFGSALGARITAIEYSLIEISNLAVILFLKFG